MIFVKNRIIFVLVFMISIPLAFAQTNQEPFLSVQTDDNHYDEGDTIVISGKVQTVVADTPILLQIWFEGNMIYINQFEPAQDGSYSHTVLAEKPKWSKEGEYLIRVSYSEGNTSERSITYTPKKEFIEIEDSFEVEIPNGGTFDAEYTILGGQVTDMILEPDNFTLRIIIDAPDEGTLSIKLPRESIDAVKPNGEDESFIVLIGDVQFPYSEDETDSQARIISINFEENDTEIEIIGTRVVPEFGSIAVLVLVAGVLGTIFLTRNKIGLQISN